MTQENLWDRTADDYVRFLNSPIGRVQRELMSEAVAHLIQKPDSQILDIGCGEGYLANHLTKQGHRVVGFDISQTLINRAKRQFPWIDFRVGDAVAPEDYPDQQFDAAIANLMMMNLPELATFYCNAADHITSGGQLVCTIVNPYYSYPVGVWKRGVWGRLTLKRPRLIVRDYFGAGEFLAEFGSSGVVNYHHKLSDYLNQATQAGFEFTQLVEPKTDVAKHPRNLFAYENSVVPLLLVLVFRKR
ncbi:MAG: class I SAM-dependent methyltransferase [bacterium]